MCTSRPATVRVLFIIIFLESPERTATKRAELERDAARLRETHAYYRNRLVGLLRLAGIDSGPGETNPEEY